MRNLFLLFFIMLGSLNVNAAVITHGGTLPDSAQKSDFYAIIDTATLSAIVNSDVSSTAAIVASKLDLSSPGTIGNTSPNSGKFTSLVTTGNVGVSSVTPGSQLDVQGTVRFLGTGTTIINNGNVGIGSSSPGQALDVVGTIRSNYLIGPIDDPYIKSSNTQNSGTDGGTATSGSWLTYTLNTKDSDTTSIATLSGNQISIPAGTYKVFASSLFHATNEAQIRLYNVTDSAILLNGTMTYAAASSNASPSSTISGEFTISGTKTIAIQYQIGSTEANDGLGIHGGFGSEVYGYVELFKKK